MARIKFMNTEIDSLSMEEALTEIDVLVQKRGNAYVVTPNADHIVRLEKDEEFRKVYRCADLILPDGKPIIWISKLYGRPVKEKVSGSDLFPRLCEMAARKGYSMYFLGAAEGVAKKAADNLMARYSGLNVKGSYSPPFGFEKDTEETNRIIRLVRAAEPDILVVGLGSPKQEKFIYSNLEKLNVPVSLGLGASLDFEAGNIRRAPKWMSNHGLEWLYRFSREPGRLFRRYFIDDMKIFRLAWKYRKQSDEDTI